MSTGGIYTKAKVKVTKDRPQYYNLNSGHVSRLQPFSLVRFLFNQKL